MISDTDSGLLFGPPCRPILKTLY